MIVAFFLKFGLGKIRLISMAIGISILNDDFWYYRLAIGHHLLKNYDMAINIIDKYLSTCLILLF